MTEQQRASLQEAYENLNYSTMHYALKQMGKLPHRNCWLCASGKNHLEQLTKAALNSQ